MAEHSATEESTADGVGALEVVQRAVVEQAIDGANFGSFNKEVLRAQVSSGRTLALVRKYREDLERKGVVLLIHGFAQNRYTWHLSSRSLVNYFADAGLDVYNLELTGHGRSRDFGSTPATSFEEYVVDTSLVIPAVARYSGSRQIFLMGHSLGGAVCYAAAPRAPKYLAGVVTVAGMFSFGSNPLTRSVGRLVGRIAGEDSALTRLGASIKTRFMGKIVAEQFEAADAISAAFPLAGWVPGSTEPHVVQERLLKGFDQSARNWLQECGMQCGLSLTFLAALDLHIDRTEDVCESLRRDRRRVLVPALLSCAALDGFLQVDLDPSVVTNDSLDRACAPRAKNQQWNQNGEPETQGCEALAHHECEVSAGSCALSGSSAPSLQNGSCAFQLNAPTMR